VQQVEEIEMGQIMLKNTFVNEVLIKVNSWAELLGLSSFQFVVVCGMLAAGLMAKWQYQHHNHHHHHE
jgi:hypothetical protein